MLTRDLPGLRLEREAIETSLSVALRRALDAAASPQGSPGPEPWRFYPMEGEAAASIAWLAARRLEADVGPEGARAAYEQWRGVPGWVAVTCLRSDSDEQLERDREATLSAAQRASLSLWSDNVPSNWLPDLIREDPALLELIGADAELEMPVGVLLYGHPDR